MVVLSGLIFFFDLRLVRTKSNTARTEMPKFLASKLLEELSNEEREEYDERIAMLTAKLGHAPRDDSKLAYMFGTGAESRDVETVAHEIHFTEALYNQTQYPDVIESRLRQIAEKVHGNDISWKTSWRLTKRYGTAILKIEHAGQLLQRLA